MVHRQYVSRAPPRGGTQIGAAPSGGACTRGFAMRAPRGALAGSWGHAPRRPARNQAMASPSCDQNRPKLVPGLVVPAAGGMPAAWSSAMCPLLPPKRDFPGGALRAHSHTEDGGDRRYVAGFWTIRYYEKKVCEALRPAPARPHQRPTLG